MKQIKNINEIKQACNLKENYVDFFISFGFARSSKEIIYHKDIDLFVIHNNIDDTIDEFSSIELLNSNIGNSIKKGTFYTY